MTNNNLPQWNLTKFYQSLNDPQIKEDLSLIEKNCEEFSCKYLDKISQLQSNELYLAITQYEEISEKIGKIAAYSYLIYAIDTSNSTHLSFYQNNSEELNKLQSKLLFFSIEINKLPQDIIDNHLKDDNLKKYQTFIRDIRAYKKHQLSNELEKFSLEKSITGCNAFIRLFDEISNNLEFNYDNKILSCQEVFDLMSNNDENIRKNAAKAIGKTLKANSKIFAFITNILAKDKDISDKWRGFKSPISSRNLDNFIEDEIVELLIKKVKENYKKISHNYYNKKAKLLNKKSLNYWDRNAPLSNNDNSKISWHEAQNIVLDAYQEFSPKMAKIGQKFFDNNWIDAKVTKGKDSGAFSHPCTTSTHPCILMNYQGKIRDIMTLAHELGHGVHQFLSAKQGYLMSSTPLTLSETASVFGEQLTFQKILKNENDNNKKKLIIANKVEDMINTVIRQIAFLEFETKVHSERKKGEISLEKLCQFWMDVQQESLGPIFNYDEEYKYFWSYIPHFIHSPFYVYSYAFGDCLVNSLYGVYKSNKIPNFEQKYIEMLEAGGTKHHKELLAPFNLSIKDESFWQEGLDVIADYIEQI